MKPPVYYQNRARECRKYAVALAALSGACAIAFACVDHPGLTGVAELLPLLLASGGLSCGIGGLNELREGRWWLRMADMEAAFQPVEEAWISGEWRRVEYDVDSSFVVGSDAGVSQGRVFR